MTAPLRAGVRHPVAANLAALRRMLGRLRDPDGAAGARRRRIAVFAGAGVAAVLVVLFLFTLDGQSVAWWEGLSRRSRRWFELATRFGKSDWLLVPTAVFCLALLCADWRRTSRRVAAAWIELGNLVAFFFFAVALSGIATNLVKWTLGRSRPVLFESDGAFSLSPISFGYEHVSFPSGHSTTAAAAAMALALVFRGRLVVVALCILFAVTIGLSRVGVRAHYPSDVVAGLFMGCVVTFLYAHALGRHGVAFQRRADGTLMPKTAAIRGVFGGPDGWRRAFTGLAAAWFGTAPGAAAVDKRR